MPWAYNNLSELVQMKENENKVDFLWVEVFSPNCDVKWLTLDTAAAAALILTSKKQVW